MMVCISLSRCLGGEMVIWLISIFIERSSACIVTQIHNQTKLCLVIWEILTRSKLSIAQEYFAHIAAQSSNTTNFDENLTFVKYNLLTEK